MNMMDFLKKSFAFSLGAAAFSAEKLKQFADEMVSRGEISSEDAKRFMEDVSAKAEEEKKTVQDWMREQSCKILQQAGAADAARVDALERRVAALESRLSILPEEIAPSEDCD